MPYIFQRVEKADTRNGNDERIGACGGMVPVQKTERSSYDGVRTLGVLRPQQAR